MTPQCHAHDDSGTCCGPIKAHDWEVCCACTAAAACTASSCSLRARALCDCLRDERFSKRALSTVGSPIATQRLVSVSPIRAPQDTPEILAWLNPPYDDDAPMTSSFITRRKLIVESTPEAGSTDLRHRQSLIKSCRACIVTRAAWRCNTAHG